MDIAGSTGSSKPDAAVDSILGFVREEDEVKEVASVPTPSISSVLKDLLLSMRSPMETTVTTDMFLDVEGKEKEKFVDGYSAFVASVHRMEGYICNYLKVRSLTGLL